MARTDPQVNIRLPSSLKTELDDLATKSGRSLTAEIVQRLQGSLDAQSPVSQKREMAIKELSEHAEAVARYWDMDDRDANEEAMLADAISDLALWQRQVAKLSP